MVHKPENPAFAPSQTPDGSVPDSCEFRGFVPNLSRYIPLSAPPQGQIQPVSQTSASVPRVNQQATNARISRGQTRTNPATLPAPTTPTQEVHIPMTENQPTLQESLDSANRLFQDRATEVLNDPLSIELLVGLHHVATIQLELIDTVRYALPLAKLTAANFCRIGVNDIWVTDTGNDFIKSLESQPEPPVPSPEGQPPALPQPIEARLLHLADLQDNWDQYGATPPAATTIQRAQSFLNQAIPLAGPNLPYPYINATHAGDMTLHWKTPGGNELIVIVPAQQDQPPRFLLVRTDLQGKQSETEAQLGTQWTLRRVMNALIQDQCQQPYNPAPQTPNDPQDQPAPTGARPKAIETPTNGEMELHFRRKTAEALNDREAMLLLQYMHQHRLIESSNFNYQHNGNSLAKLTAAHLCEISANTIHITHRGDHLFQEYSNGPMRHHLDPLPKDTPMEPRLPSGQA